MAENCTLLVLLLLLELVPGRPEVISSDPRDLDDEDDDNDDDDEASEDRSTWWVGTWSTNNSFKGTLEEENETRSFESSSSLVGKGSSAISI